MDIFENKNSNDDFLIGSQNKPVEEIKPQPQESMENNIPENAIPDIVENKENAIDPKDIEFFDPNNELEEFNNNEDGTDRDKYAEDGRENDILDLEDGDRDTFQLSDDIISNLEAVNDDFASEIEAEKTKKIEEEKKQTGKDKEEAEEEMELKPLEDSEEKLDDIINLNLGNIEEFLQTNAKTTGEPANKEKPTPEPDKKENNKNEISNNGTGENSSNGAPLPIGILDDFEINEDLWDELNLSDELKEKVTNRVKIEIKAFIQDHLIPVIEKIIK